MLNYTYFLLISREYAFFMIKICAAGVLIKLIIDVMILKSTYFNSPIERQPVFNLSGKNFLPNSRTSRNFFGSSFLPISFGS